MSVEYLRKLDDGYVYIRTEALSKRSDMIPCDSEGRRLFEEGQGPTDDTTDMEIGGKKFSVPKHLVSVINELEVAAEHREESVLEKEVKDLTEKLNDSTMKSGALRKDNISISAANTELQEKLSRSIKEASNLNKEVEKLEQLDKDNKSEIKKLKKELRDLNSD